MENLLRPSDTARDASYGDLAHAPMAMATSFEGARVEPGPEPAGCRRCNRQSDQHTRQSATVPHVVDKMGMGDPIGGYNDQLEQIHQALYGAFGMEGMLELKV